MAFPLQLTAFKTDRLWENSSVRFYSQKTLQEDSGRSYIANPNMYDNTSGRSVVGEYNLLVKNIFSGRFIKRRNVDGSGEDKCTISKILVVSSPSVIGSKSHRMKTTLRRSFIGHGLIALSLAKKSWKCSTCAPKREPFFQRYRVSGQGVWLVPYVCSRMQMEQCKPRMFCYSCRSFWTLHLKDQFACLSKTVVHSHCSAVFINLMDTNSMLQQSFQHSDTISKVSAS